MTIVLQVCMVVVTLAIAMIAIVVMRAMGRFDEVAQDYKHTSEVVRDLVADAGAVTRQLQEVAVTIENLVPQLERGCVAASERRAS
jgi:hypothetical protein